MDSKIFGSKRKVVVTSPLKLSKKSGDINTILYLDADDPHINGTILQAADNLISTNEIPESYLIGIIHEDRNTELVEKHKLLKFIKDEVLPFLENKYPISKKLTIVGHSFGAYFATYAYLSNNSVFNSCIAISPAYWPNKADISPLLDKKIEDNALTGNLYLAIGDRRWDDISLRDNTFKANDILKTIKGLRFEFNDLKGFSHNATPTAGFGLGLSFIYDEWGWITILNEQNSRLQSFPDFWGHLEIKGDALSHLNRKSEAKLIFTKALANAQTDKEISKSEKRKLFKRIRIKIKNLK